MTDDKFCITQEDIINADIETLRKMRVEIAQHTTNIMVEYAKYTKLTGKQRRYLVALKGLKKLCHTRLINHIENQKEQGLWKSPRQVKAELHLYSLFVAEAKKRLSKDVYNEIMEVAKANRAEKYCE